MWGLGAIEGSGTVKGLGPFVGGGFRGLGLIGFKDMGDGGVMDSGALVNRAIKDIKSRVLQALAFPKARALFVHDGSYDAS